MTKLPPKKVLYPDIDLLSVINPSTSVQDSIDKQTWQEKNNPLPRIDFTCQKNMVDSIHMGFSWCMQELADHTEVSNIMMSVWQKINLPTEHRYLPLSASTPLGSSSILWFYSIVGLTGKHSYFFYKIKNIFLVRYKYTLLGLCYFDNQKVLQNSKVFYFRFTSKGYHQLPVKLSFILPLLFLPPNFQKPRL